METLELSYPINSSCREELIVYGELAYNLWWTWNPDAQRLFARIDNVLWEKTNHNAIQFLQLVDPTRLKNFINDRYSLDYYDRILRSFDEYMKLKSTWFANANSNI